MIHMTTCPDCGGQKEAGSRCGNYGCISLRGPVDDRPDNWVPPRRRQPEPMNPDGDVFCLKVYDWENEDTCAVVRLSGDCFYAVIDIHKRPGDWEWPQYLGGRDEAAKWYKERLQSGFKVYNPIPKLTHDLKKRVQDFHNEVEAEERAEAIEAYREAAHERGFYHASDAMPYEERARYYEAVGMANDFEMGW